ncbi:hypothetical protein P154DRAFT_521119 [Amniculicola lignicola CBS 123094]|uniref:R3H-associated N-terminal domain-containing protein n=1 Tax=Amniculicola lignicola CBS 123094 TaxID=1392246 RepID=A0A6A5WTB2_9PLEO|nr:hypothetical protein P154DRAFT_521119 [Amniculicola lignicola CBS 123094]
MTITAASGVPGATISLQIPLDDTVQAGAHPAVATGSKETSTVFYRHKEPARRDSMKRREAMAKGKEGSRRRQRWENDRLLNNPHAEPPLPKDWEIRPTHPVHHVPYYLAPLWDAGLSARVSERKAAASKAKHSVHVSTQSVASKPTTPGVVPKELREKLKKSRGAKGLLMDLENSVREFVAKWEEREKKAQADGIPADPDSDDEEIVFIGRNGAMSDRQTNTATGPDVKREIMLFDTPAADKGGSFGRWLVHHIGVYYGLKTWSVTVGNPARREAYIGLKTGGVKALNVLGAMPRPLWGLV